MNNDMFGHFVYRILAAADIVKSDRLALSCRRPGGTASIPHLPLAADTIKTPTVKPNRRKSTVRNFGEDHATVGFIPSPPRAMALRIALVETRCSTSIFCFALGYGYLVWHVS
jgi:hypothetical protein